MVQPRSFKKNMRALSNGTEEPQPVLRTMPPKHQEVRIDAVVNDVISKSKAQDLKAFPDSDLNYNARLGAERVIRSQRRKD